MKLYTEQQVRRAYIDGMSFIAVDPTKYEQDAEEYVRDVHPIELPSDEEIGQEFKFLSENWEIRQAAEHGAQWMRDKLTNIKEK